MMDGADLARTRQDFADAAERAGTAGFEIVEIHMAHGYLLQSFLSPLSNRRNDGYGGDRQGRTRFPLEVAEAVARYGRKSCRCSCGSPRSKASTAAGSSRTAWRWPTS